MGVPKSVVKVKKNGIEFISNVDRVNYTLNELIRAALRDIGRLVCKRTRQKIRKRTGKGARNIQYWVRHKQKTPDLQVGLKPKGWYLGFQETGAINVPKIGALQESTKENINNIRLITGKYLSAIEDENRALGLISEDDYEGE